MQGGPRYSVVDQEQLLDNREMIFKENTIHNHLIECIKFSSDI